MGNDELTVAIVATECAVACAEEPDLIERIKKAMRPVVHEHWSTTDEDARFRGAVAAAYADPLTTEEDKQRITFTLKKMQALNAMLSGVQIDIDALTAGLDEIEPIPLVSLWKDAKKEGNESDA